METQNSPNFLTKQEKLLFGVCSRLSQKLNVSPVIVRIAFIVLTFIFIPLGIATYLVLYMVNQHHSKVLIFSVLGMFLGVPLSYYFQSDIFKLYSGGTGMFGYVSEFFKNVERFDNFTGNGWDIVFNLLFSVAIFTVLGGLLGYFIETSKKSKIQKDEI